jgi:23S rRNA pseudouridine2605 synthase
MLQRIQKILSQRGVASRRKAEELILAGRVTCNGHVCSLGDSADPDTDTITVDGVPLPRQEQRVYIMLHKPRGYVTTLSDERGRKNAAQLVADCGQRVYPVGRLDMDSEGLLLFTNDGAFANAMMHPRQEVDKTYRVTVMGYTPQALELVKRPIVLDGYRIKPPQVELEQAADGRAVLEITIHEGRNRQVRRMCAAAGMPVKRLVRIREGAVTLGELPLGKWRYLSDEEIQLLFAEAGI